MNSHFDSSALQLSALQLAWLHELGIEKPWIPMPRQADQVQVSQARQASESAESSVSQDTETKITQTDVAPSSNVLGAQTTATPSRPVSRFAQPVSKILAPVVRAGATETSALAAQAQTLDSLAQGIASCQACGLCMDREHVVVGQGVMQPAVMVVGEAPGEQEDRQGEPFVGRSGMLLDNMLSAIDLGREKNVYVANIIKCRPPGNRNPRPEEVAACRPFLLRQIEFIKPLSILAVGKHAAQALLGVEAPLVSMRGQTYTLPHPGHTVPVVVTYHPAYLLRRPAEKALAWKDLNQTRDIVRAITGD